MLFLLIAVFILITLLDLKELLGLNNKPVAVILYSIIMLCGLTIGILLILDRAPQSPAVLIEKIIGLLPGR